MKKLLFFSLLLFSVHAKSDNNIVSVTFGQGPTAIDQTSTAASSSSDTVVHGGQGQNQGGGNGSTHINSDITVPSSSAATQHYDFVFGGQFQHKVEGSPFWIGVLIQSNQTYSISYGIGF